MSKIKQLFCKHSWRRYYSVDIQNKRHSWCIKCGKWRNSKYAIRPTDATPQLELEKGK